jgi:tetratricopeptide (TPR) repeat protein
MELDALLHGLRDDPASAKSWLDCAESFQAQGRDKAARKILRKAGELALRSSSHLERAATLLERAGEYAAAQACLDRILERRPDSTVYRLQEARLLWNCSSLIPLDAWDGREEPGKRLLWAAGRLREKTLALEKALKRGPLPEEVVEQAFSFFIDTGEFERAEAGLRVVLGRAPSAAAQAGLAQVSLWRGRAAAALARARKALRLDPDFPPALRCLAGALVLQGKFREAQRELSRLLRRDPRDAEARLWRGEVFLKQGRLAAARRELALATRLGHGSPALVLQKTLLRGGSRPLPSWKNSLERALKGMRGNRSSIETSCSPSGLLLRTPSRAKPANDLYDRFSSDPNSAQALVAGCMLRQATFKPPESLIADYSALISEMPQEPEFYAHRGEMKLWLGRYEDALEDLASASRLKNVRMWWMVAQAGVWMLQGKPREALQRLEESQRRGALLSSIAPWRAECLRRLGRNAQVPAELLHVRSRFPFHVSTWINLSLAYGALGNHQGSMSLFKGLAEQAPLLLADASRAAGIDPKTPAEGRSAETVKDVLETALRMMRGNRSALCATYILPGGSFRVARLHGC